MEFGFINPNTQQTLEEAATNVLKIKNNTRFEQEISVNISLPDGWQTLSKPGRVYTIAPSDSLFIPVRIIPSKSAKGNTNYIINAFLITTNGFQMANDYWYVEIKKISNWNVSIPKKKIYFPNETHTAEFDILLTNSGNSDEKISLDFLASRNLIITGIGEEDVISPFTIHLPAGMDSLIKCKVRKITDTRKITAISEDSEESSEKHSMKVTVRDEGGNENIARLWRGNVDFFELGNQIRVDGFGYSSLPVTVEMNTFDVMDNTSLMLSIYGTSYFNKDRTLIYRYQSNFINNFLEARSYVGDYHYLAFLTRKGGFEVGNISGGKHGAFLGGKGARAIFRTKRNELSAMYVRNPELFRNTMMSGFAVNNILRFKNAINDTYTQTRWDELAKIRSTVLSTSLALKLSRNHLLRLGGGASYEEHNWNPSNPVKLFGHSHEISYSGRIKKLHVVANHRYGSKSYSAFRGVFSASTLISYDINKKHDISFLANYYRQSPEQYSGGVLLPDPPATMRTRYEMRWAINTATARIIIRPYYLYHELVQLRTATKAIGFDYRPNTSESDFRFYASVDAGFVNALDVNIPEFFIAQVFGNFRYRNFNTSIRYYYGPFQAIEQIRYVQSRQNPQRIMISPFLDQWIIKSRLLVRTNSNFNYDTNFDRLGFILRPETFYFAKNDLTLSFYMEYLLSSSGTGSSFTGTETAAGRTGVSDFNIGAGIRKSFGIPLNRKKFHIVEIIVFKDVNGNGRLDAGEETVENMLINIRTSKTTEPDPNDSMAYYAQDNLVNYELLTGKDGTVKFDNLPTGFYSIKALPLTESGGWFYDKVVQEMISSRKKIYLPLNKAARMTGNIVMERDKYSKIEGEIDLSRIRVTAVSSTGQTYSTLTGKNGEFNMFLPVGEYMIDINKTALGDLFEFVTSNVKINLNDPNNSYSITFYVREKKRMMNIKEFKN